MSDQKHATATAAPNQTSEGAAPPSELVRLIQQPRRELDLMDNAQFAGALALAQQMSTAAGFVPRHLLGNAGACLGVVSLAAAWRVNPFLLAACTSLVPPEGQNQKLMFEGKAIHAGLLRSGILSGPPTFEFRGDWSKIVGKTTLKQSQRGGTYLAPGWAPEDEEGLEVWVTGTRADRGTPETVKCRLRAMQPRNSTLWASNPETQAHYAATRMFARLVTPELMLGVVSTDEYDPATEAPQAQAAQPAAPPAALAIVRPRKRAATLAEGAEQAAKDAANALAAPPAANPDAPRFQPTSALAAVEAAGIDRPLFVRWLKGTGRWPKQGLDGLSAASCEACVTNPAKVAREVSDWVTADDLAREQELSIMDGADQKREG